MGRSNDAIPLHPEQLRLPDQAQLARRAHVAEQRRGGDDRGAREVALPSHAQAVRPVAIERRDRALARGERVGALAEAGAAPRLADLTAGGAEHRGDALAIQPRIGVLNLALDAARAGEDHELALS